LPSCFLFPREKEGIGRLVVMFEAFNDRAMSFKTSDVVCEFGLDSDSPEETWYDSMLCLVDGRV
jgi:hypothetical protein